ncbi:MAG: hypothetical protein J6N76_06915 [Lachnospiraceae bacterium]|nr:hypothetical protein [Lachnospiraceae bacterium]
MELRIKIQNMEIPVEWENHSAVNTIIQKLSSVLRIQMSKKGTEQIGPFNITVPRNDRSIIAQPGDIAIRGGNQLVLFAAEDDVSVTKLGHIKNYSETQIKNLLSPSSMQLEFFEK